MKHICATCLRPIYGEPDGRWFHLDATFDSRPGHDHPCEPMGTLTDTDVDLIIEAVGS